MRRISAKIISSTIGFHENGKMGYKYIYINAYHHADYWFHENGKLRSMYTYINGTLNGYYWIHENGKLGGMSTYIDGKLVKKCMYRIL